MKNRRIVSAIEQAIGSGKMQCRFTIAEFRRACPGFAYNTYSTFPAKHSEGNLGGNTVLSRRLGRGDYLFLLEPCGGQKE